MEDTEIVPLSFDSILTDYGDFSAQQVQVLQYIVNGFTINQITTMVKSVSRLDVEKWLRMQDFREAALRMQQSSNTWHAEARSRMKFLATQKIEEILAQDYVMSSDKERREIARTARFIIEEDDAMAGLGAGNTFVNAPQLNITDSSVDLIAQQIRRLEANDSQDLTKKWDIFETPRVHALHMETDYGVINYDSETNEFQCHACGEWFVDLYSHALKKHSMSEREYNLAFRIPTEDIE